MDKVDIFEKLGGAKEFIKFSRSTSLGKLSELEQLMGQKKKEITNLKQLIHNLEEKKQSLKEYGILIRNKLKDRSDLKVELQEGKKTTLTIRNEQLTQQLTEYETTRLRAGLNFTKLVVEAVPENFGYFIPFMNITKFGKDKTQLDKIIEESAQNISNLTEKINNKKKMINSLN